MKIKKINPDGTEVEVEVAVVYDTQEDLNKALKSANSQGKGEILKTLGVNSVEEAKTKMGAQTQVEELTGKVETLQAELERETLLRQANELGVKPELAQRVIILAKASKNDNEDFKTVLEREAKAINAIVEPQKTNPNPAPDKKVVIGTPKTKEEMDLEEADRKETERLRNL